MPLLLLYILKSTLGVIKIGLLCVVVPVIKILSIVLKDYMKGGVKFIIVKLLLLQHLICKANEFYNFSWVSVVTTDRTTIVEDH